MDPTVHILLIEDNLGDIRLIQEVLKGSDHKHELDIVTDGEQAVHFLKKEGKFAEATTPNLIFLDLNLPKKDGREVLAEIKTSDKLKTIPVIIFSSSEAEKDIQKSYDLHANCYVVKPFDFNEFSKVIQAIQAFWLNIVKLPE
ncbi:MAG: response regulator [Sphingobacteriales bacterium]|nr:MAG: response regulator [Sphingobacteriales bacterium]